ncbi:MAG: hypothetical protein ACI9YP_001708, partial [Colwellia sp.]
MTEQLPIAIMPGNDLLEKFTQIKSV